MYEVRLEEHKATVIYHTYHEHFSRLGHAIRKTELTSVCYKAFDAWFIIYSLVVVAIAIAWQRQFRQQSES